MKLSFLIFLSLCILVVLTRKTGSTDGDVRVLKAVRDQMDTERIGEFIRKMSKWSRNTQSDWMLAKTKTTKQLFRSLGLKVVTKKYHVLQCFPIQPDPSVAEVLGKDGAVLATFREDGDAKKKIVPAFNAWSKSGTVEGEPVYVNFGRRQDFEKLLEMGIDLEGKIGIARYGKIYRGDKAKFAHQYGLIGLIIYMDAQQYAPEGTEVYPDGPGLPPSGVQRGTIKQGFGDPSTYLYPSTEYANAEEPEEYEKRLPQIVVMPTSFQNGLPLLAALAGDVVEDEDWMGAGNSTYPTYRYGPGFEGSAGYQTLRITVNLEFRRVEVENVFGVLEGKQEPDRWIMIGNHRDTWVNGGIDATTGFAVLHEIAQGFAPFIEKGWRPRRSIVFASWAAEEQGLIGSTEFVEDHLHLLRDRLVAYINVDVAADNNVHFKPKATPNFRELLDRSVMAASAPLSEFSDLYKQWQNTSESEVPEAATLGSGSDYTAFLQSAGISCLDLTFRGSSYYSYHTEYDTFEYLRDFADPGFRAIKSVSEVTLEAVMELACSSKVPLSAVTYARYLSDTMNRSNLTGRVGDNVHVDVLYQAIEDFVEQAERYEEQRNKTFGKNTRNEMKRRRLNDQMMQLERAFTYPPGLPDRPANRHLLFAPSLLDSYSGAAFPGIFDTLAMVEEDPRYWAEVRKQVTLATWATHSATRALSLDTFP